MTDERYDKEALQAMYDEKLANGEIPDWEFAFIPLSAMTEEDMQEFSSYIDDGGCIAPTKSEVADKYGWYIVLNCQI